MGERSEVHGRQLRVESPPLVTRHSSLAIVGPLRAGDPDSIGTGHRLRGREEGGRPFDADRIREAQTPLAPSLRAAPWLCHGPALSIPGKLGQGAAADGRSHP